MKLNNTNRSTLRAIAITLLLLVVISMLFKDRRSMYEPRTISIEPVSEMSLSSLKSSPECTNDSVYSTSMGGVCGGQQLVQDHANYKIVD